MWHAWERGKMCTKFCWECQKERDHLENKGILRKMGSECILGKMAGGCGLDSTDSG
jgi:hypothetical protein